MFFLKVSPETRRAGWFGAVLVAILTCVYLIYRIGFSAPLVLDNANNLGGLSTVRDWNSAALFIFGGESGPLGRPLALASFLLNASSWPWALPDLFYTNTLIHLLNGVLVAWLSLIVTRLMRPAPLVPEGIALCVAAAWLLAPLLASTSFILVQRMTSLSATMTFAGLIAYVYGRALCDRRQLAGILLMSLGIGLGTVLGVLTKESGMLLPAYAWVLEATLLASARLPAPRWLRAWKAMFIWLPLMLFFAYFCYSLQPIFSGYHYRDFTLTERLLTEPRVLADYFRLILLPGRSAMGPFQDDYIISRNVFDPATTAIAGLFWLAATVLAVISRRKVPVLAFAVLWFLVGHSLEGSVIPLEVYFEHRNYIPAMGPIFALAWGVWAVPAVYRRVAITLFLVWLGLAAFVLSETVRVWADPLLAAELWAAEHPRSERAALFLSQRYFAAHDARTAYRVLTESQASNPDLISLSLYRVHAGCFAEDSAGFRQLVNDTLPGVKTGRFSPAVADSMQQLMEIALNHQCAHVKPENVHALAAALLANPNVAAHRRTKYLIHHMQARMHLVAHEFNQTVYHLEQAYAHAPTKESRLETGLLLSGVLASAGLHKEALQKLNAAQKALPRNPIIADHWRTQFDALRVQLLKTTTAPAK